MARAAPPELSPVPNPPDAPEAPRSRRPLVLGLAGAVLAAIGVVWFLEHGRESTDDAQIDADVVAVPTHLAGTVTKVLFVENQRVEAGALLAELDDAQVRARLQQAEATLAQATAQADAADADAVLAERNAVGNRTAARATLAGAAVGEKSSSEQLVEGAAQLSSAEASFTQAEQDLQRARQLSVTGAISKAELDKAETNHRLADSSLRLARARIDTLRSSVSAAKSRIEEASARAAQSSDVSTAVRLARSRAASAHAQVDVARAQRDLAALDFSYTRVQAPQAGIVSRKAINVGQQISSGQPIVQLVTDARWVTANFKETQVGRMKIGQPVKIAIDAFSGHTLQGQIESLSGGTGARFSLLPPDNATGNFTKVVQRVPVRIKLAALPSDLVLRPGMSANVTVDVR